METFSDTFIEILGKSGEMCVESLISCCQASMKVQVFLRKKGIAFEKGALENR